MVFQWAAAMQSQHPVLSLLFAIPNGGKRSIITAAMLKAEGVKPGVPDLFFPVPKDGVPGLFIEMKRQKRGSLSLHQKAWQEALTEQGYAVRVAKGADAAITILKHWLELKKEDI
jgi:hypothetical protein